MTGFEFRLWRRGLNWTQERAAEELGISLRTYKNYEKSFPPLMAELAIETLSTIRLVTHSREESVRKPQQTYDLSIPNDDYKMAAVMEDDKENSESQKIWFYVGADNRDPGFANVGITMNDMG